MSKQTREEGEYATKGCADCGKPVMVDLGFKGLALCKRCFDKKHSEKKQE